MALARGKNNRSLHGDVSHPREEPRRLSGHHYGVSGRQDPQVKRENKSRRGTPVRQIRNRQLLAVLICTVTALGQTVVTTPAVVTSARVPGTVFRDCSDCPEMVVVPAGKFTM